MSTPNDLPESPLSIAAPAYRKGSIAMADAISAMFISHDMTLGDSEYICAEAIRMTREILDRESADADDDDDLTGIPLAAPACTPGEPCESCQ